MWIEFPLEYLEFGQAGSKDSIRLIGSEPRSLIEERHTTMIDAELVETVQERLPLLTARGDRIDSYHPAVS